MKRLHCCALTDCGTPLTGRHCDCEADCDLGEEQQNQPLQAEGLAMLPPILHPSHKWGQRPIFERVAPGSNLAKWRVIPCCLNCLVDGFEDVWDAFQPCRRETKP